MHQHFLRSIPLVQVNLFSGFSAGVFSVVSMYTLVHFLRKRMAGTVYLAPIVTRNSYIPYEIV
jgi:hypothetical protein